MKIIRDMVKVGQKIVVGAIAVEVLSLFLDPMLKNGNATFVVAVSIVGGGFWIYRKRHPRSKDKFGEGLRGSEVEDHTDNP